MKKILTTIILSIGIAGSIAAGTGWELRYDQPEGILEIHGSSVYPRTKTEHRGWRKVRTRITYPVIQVDSARHRFMTKELVEMVSCSDRMRYPLSEIKYSGKFGNGKPIDKHTWSHARPVFISPGSTEELILGEANCDLLTGKWATTGD